ncbi:MAG: helix-turn-helix domain-containing protein [Gemmatimonadaceae bacterium]
MSGDAALLPVPRVKRPVSVAVCGCTTGQATRIRDALRGRADIHFVDSENGVLERLSLGEHAWDVVIVAVGAEEAPATRLVRAIVQSPARAAVIVYCEPARNMTPNIAGLAAAGAHQFLFWGVNDGGIILREILEAARRQSAADGAMLLLRPVIPASLYPFVEAALTDPSAVKDVRSLADAVRVHRRTLFNRCARVSCLNPTELLTWTRLTLVGLLLETTGATVETIAMQLGYPSPAALRNTIKRYTGLRATEIRVSGGARLVVHLMRGRMQGRNDLHLV